MKTLLIASLLFCGAAFAASPSSINNDDSCDIKVGPAATLLLPYFEVDTDRNSGQTTLFTITNVSRYPQIAHVTLWSDAAFPVLNFNLYLTGYDVQAINLADVLVRDVIAPPSGTTSATTPGTLSASANGNLRAPLDCAGNPGVVPESIMSAVRFALRTGLIRFPGGASCNNAGNVHFDAIGYATIDVVASCTQRMPSDPLYYTNDLLFDNVLIGDYQQIGSNPAGTSSGNFDATGNPMVHIRAVPEGGGAGADVGTALPYTFYDRYTPAGRRTLDRRQPLPSAFAARFVQGGPADFATNLMIWREGIGTGTCASSLLSEQMVVPDIIRFDEHENAFISVGCFEPPGECPVTLPPTSSTNTKSFNYPQMGGPDVGGWIYINANNGGSTTYSVTQNIGGVPVPTNARTALAPAGSTTTIGPRPSQNWITTAMFGVLAGNHITAELDAMPLGNGCSPAAFMTPGPRAPAGAPPIAPAGGAFVCPPGTTLTNGTTALCTGTNVNPKP